MSKKIDLTGRRFGRLVALRPCQYMKRRQTVWLCLCDCGNEKEVVYMDLKKGDTKSCGCLLRYSQIYGSIKHGYTINGIIRPEYGIWLTMKNRCNNRSVKCFKHYGGRGVKVCDRWMESFDNFISDMGNRPTVKHSLDRFPDNDGDYTILNCRWATKEEQGSNKRNNKWIEFNGKRFIQAEWARILNMDVRKLHYHLSRMNINEVIARFTPEIKL